MLSLNSLPAGTVFVGPPSSPSKLRSQSSVVQGGVQAEDFAADETQLIAGGSILVSGALAVATAGRRKRTQRIARRQSSAAVSQASSADLEDGLTLESDLGIDYSKLRDLLCAKEFKAADAETRSLLIKMSGEEAVKRGWIYWAEVRRIPEKDMSTLEGLWQFCSDGRFGFAQQHKIWKKQRGQFDKFALEVSWFTDTWTNRNWPDEFVYTMEAPVGHLPLTNCIRGAQVLQELLDHPAVASKKAVAVQKTTSPAAESSDEKPQRRSALSMLARGPPCSSISSSACLTGATWSASLHTPRASQSVAVPVFA
eukprot:TRINITY_DN105820_c0_g1_i1.p1 TRINITY_DN105820_c0_g1~~TRINITY_DN105820_c0_g1_i1.p1  ORF type:complete len:311 (+),score=56.21 TRINITY_DN105820_c0_g1_i1:55-987(+)